MKKAVLACLLFMTLCITVYSQSVTKDTINAKVNQIVNQEQIISEPVTFNGEKIFSISGTDEAQLKIRAKTVNIRLQGILDQIKGHDLKISKNQQDMVRQLGNKLIFHRNGEEIITITQEDALFLHKDIKEATDYYEEQLNKKINKAYLEYQDAAYTKDQIKKAAFITLIAIFITALLGIFRKRILKSDFLFYILILGLWLYVIAKVLYLFPETRFYNALISKTLLNYYSGAILCLWAFAIISQIAKVFIRRYFEKKSTYIWSDTERKINRWNTQEILLIDLTNIVTWILAIFTFVMYTGLGSLSLLTGAGFLGLAVGYIAQDVIKDYLNGIFIFLEDQYTVGDVIRIDGFRGEVVKFSPRLTTLRDVLSAVVITIPNREIKLVENMTNTFSQIDFSMDVAYSTDLDLAIDVMHQEAEKLKGDFAHIIVDEPEMLGVEEFKDSSIRLRLVIKTLPRHQWELRRELNLRMKKAFDKNGITIPFPQRDVHHYNKSS